MIFFCNIQICEVTFKHKINESRTEFLASWIFEKIYKSKPLKNKDETKTSVDPHNHNWPNGKKWFTCYVCVCVRGGGGGGGVRFLDFFYSTNSVTYFYFSVVILLQNR